MDDMTKKLISLLIRSERLGLTFSRGSAYISIDYVREQEELRAEIAAAIAEAQKSDK